MPVEDELMSLRDVEAVTAMKKSSIYARIAARTFPRPTKIGAATRWSRAEVMIWIQEQLAARSAA